MFRSKALLMALSGKEKLSYDVCRTCRKRHIMKKTGRAMSEWTNEMFGEAFIIGWENLLVRCPAVRSTISPYDDSPETCPFRMEHIVDIIVLREERDE